MHSLVLHWDKSVTVCMRGADVGAASTSHLQRVVREDAERRPRPTAAYFLWSSQGEKTGAGAAARGVLQRPGPGASTVSLKSINIGEVQTDRAAPLPSYTHPSYQQHHISCINYCSLSHHQFVKEAHILDGYNPAQAMLWLCSRVVIKHNSNSIILALKCSWWWAEKRSRRTG